jgi:hypothetical protein
MDEHVQLRRGRKSELQCSGLRRIDIQHPSQPYSGKGSIAEFEQDLVFLFPFVRISKSHRMKSTSPVFVDVFNLIYHVRYIDLLLHCDLEKGLGVEISLGPSR